jgi:tetratricopeptide (TPR) repeat protein
LILQNKYEEAEAVYRQILSVHEPVAQSKLLAENSHELQILHTIHDLDSAADPDTTHQYDPNTSPSPKPNPTLNTPTQDTPHFPTTTHTPNTTNTPTISTILVTHTLQEQDTFALKLQIAKMLFKQKNYEEAESIYTQALPGNPKPNPNPNLNPNHYFKRNLHLKTKNRSIIKTNP